MTSDVDVPSIKMSLTPTKASGDIVPQSGKIRPQMSVCRGSDGMGMDLRWKCASTQQQASDVGVPSDFRGRDLTMTQSNKVRKVIT